jgi:hypothetical protein
MRNRFFTEGLEGQSDDAVISVCQQEMRILVTLDLDFADILRYPPRLYPGFVVLRPHWQDKSHVIDLLRRAVPLFSPDAVAHRLWIVEESRVRIRADEPGLQGSR